MASNIDPSISLAIKPPATMTLPEMLNIARGAQQYRQAEQVMPLQLEREQQLTRRGAIDLGVAETTEAERRVVQGFFSDPENFQTNGVFDLAKVNRVLPQIAPLTGREYIKDMTAIATGQTGSRQAEFSLSKDQNASLMRAIGGRMNDPRLTSGDANKAMQVINEMKNDALALNIPPAEVERMSAQAVQIALNNPKGLPQYFSNIIETQAGPEAQLGLKTPELVDVGGQFGLYRRGPGRVSTLPLPGASAQPMGGEPAPRGITGADLTAPMQQSQDRLPLLHPVRKAGVPYAALPEEESDRKSGSDFRTNLVNRQTELVTARRNLQEVIRTAQKLEEGAILPETGPIGALKRSFANWVGDPTYKQLSKDIANVQIANIKAMGGSLDTVSGQNLARMASGDETFPPEVLLSIARRADADISNLDMMATGLQKHSQKFGDNNAKRFQQMWSANADSRIFEIMNIARDVKDATKQQELTEKILSDLTLEQRQDLMRKRRNLMKLHKTGDL